MNIYFLAALAGVLAVIWEALRTFQRRHTRNIEEIVVKAITAAVGPIDKRLAVVETKMDLVIGGVAMGAATVLHHPEPSRQRIDYLLDSFRDRSITEDEMEELKGYLRTIMNWEQHDDPEFTVYPGEPAAAANMLATMDHIGSNTGELHGLLDPDSDSAEGTEA